jgi:hypothetical protein
VEEDEESQGRCSLPTALPAAVNNEAGVVEGDHVETTGVSGRSGRWKMRGWHLLNPMWPDRKRRRSMRTTAAYSLLLGWFLRFGVR